MMKEYRIAEAFRSLQGEGEHTGRSACFVRFAGCNLRCPWCDTNHEVSHIATMKDISSWIRKESDVLDMVVLTGGEPLLQLDEDTPDPMFGRYTALETNGTQPSVPPWVDWVTVSPKVGQLVILNPARISEVKVILDEKIDPESILRQLFPEQYARPGAYRRSWFIQPCDGKDDAIPLAVEYVLAHPWWKLSLQTQKIAGIA